MKRSDLIRRVRSYTRDLSNSIFRQIDVTDYINEGIDRMRTRIPQLATMPYPPGDDNPIIILPDSYQYLLAVYSASRCFSQDERHYQASTLMNEFETKLQELLDDVQSGIVIIVDANGLPIVLPDSMSGATYVKDVYFSKENGESDIDFGVGGVPS